MAVNTARIRASRTSVFTVLSDGWMYTSWVVGTSHMRAVGAEWPAAGSKLYHATGPWPLLIRDETEVEAVEPDRRIVLTARGWPLGEARIEINLADDDGDCLVTMREAPTSGPGRWVPGRLADRFLAWRNAETLARLAALVERHTKPAG